MKNLKKSNALWLLLLILNMSCRSTKNFEMKIFEKEKLNVVEIDSNRIIQECYFMNAEKENQWRHQYILSMLNEKGEVVTVYNPTNQDKDTCLAHLNKVKKILNGHSRVKLCVRDRLEKMNDPKVILTVYDFGSLGKHTTIYHGLTFDTICNSKECYSISDTWTYTCPNFKN